MPSTVDQFANFATSAIAGGAGGIGTPLNNTDTSLIVTAGDGAKFPSVAPFSMLLGTTSGAHEIVQCTARSSDTLTIVRAQESTTAATWGVGTSVQQMVTAANLANLWARIGDVYNVKLYGAKGDGTTDDTAAINAALTAANTAGGGVVFMPAGTYLTSASLVIPGSYITLRGTGDSTIITATSGSHHDIISTPIPTTVGASGFAPQRIAIESLLINCIGQTANVAGVGNGIHTYGMRYSVIRDVQVINCQNWSILLDGDNTTPGFNFSYNNVLINCITDLCNAGCWTNFSEANWFIACHFKFLRTTTTALQPAFGTQDTNVYDLRCGTGYQTVQNCVFGTGGGVTTSPALYIKNAGPQKIIGNRFDTVRYQAIYIDAADNALIVGNTFENASTVGAGTCEVIRLGGSHTIIADNRFDTTAGGSAKYTYCISEPFANTGNVITGNSFNPGTLGVLNMNATSTYQASNNDGWNPLVPIDTPPAPTVNNATTGGTVAAGTYNVEVTLVNAFGETIGSAASSTTTTTATSTISVSSPARIGNAVGFYVYVTQAGGAANTATRQQAAGSPSSFGSTYTLTAPPTNTGAVVPTTNTTTPFTQPAVPASATAYTNRFGVPCTVYVAGGTVTAITVGSQATGLTSGTIRVPAGVDITLTYSVAPTWVWIGE